MQILNKKLYNLKSKFKFSNKKQEIENLKSYNKYITSLYDGIRGFKHDFDNIINTIDGYLALDDIDGLKKYFSSLKKDCVEYNNIQVLNPHVINNPGIYSLIVSKYEKAVSFGIQVNFDFFFDFSNLHMPDYEFSRILGILLDNAIDASKESIEKKIYISFRESQKKKVQIISIENTFLDKKIDKTKIFEKGITSKENHYGIGLWEVKSIINNFDNVKLNTKIEDNLFKQELNIYF